MRKKLSSIVASITIASIFLNHIQSIPVLQNAEAASFRTTYTVFGDLNADKVIDSFDVVLMRKKATEGKYDKAYDLNFDKKIDGDDLIILSDYVLGKNCIFDAYLCDDADEDYICDMLEVAYLKTDPDSKDTDGDTLSDFEEVVYTNTSPTDKYTRKLSVTDADDDADEDKLTNKEEIDYQTSPLLTDYDDDGIDDYEEINKYNTDPKDEDSDDDNILDGDEVKLGLKPNSDKSNGSTYDYERTFDNKVPASSEVLSYINVEESPYEVSIDIKSAGNVDKALSVHIGDYSDTSEDERVIGKSVSFSYDEKLSVDSAKIYFKPDNIDESIENYMLFQFFPETNYLLPVETKYTEDSAYIETSTLGTYCLVDIKDMFSVNEKTSKTSSDKVKILASNPKVNSDEIVYDYTLDETEVLFYIDISNCATESIEATKKSIHDFSEALFEHCDAAAIQIIGYDFLSNVSGTRIQEYSDSNGSEILINLTSVDEAIEKIETDTQVAENDLDMAIYYLNNNIIRKGLFSSECKNKYVFITSDSTLSLTQKLIGYWYKGVPKDTKEILEGMQYEGIHVNTLFSDNLLKNSRAVKGINHYKEACDEYDFGVYTKSSTGYFGNTGYARVYSDAITDIQSLSVMYTCSVSPNAIPSSVERNAFINSLPPSYDKSKVPAADSDGNVNFKDAAVKVGAVSLDKNENLVFKNLYNACDESDLTRNGYEQLTQNMETSKKLVWDSFQITPFSDKILYNDDDGDGIPNKYDPYPDEPFDERFEIVNDFSYEPSVEFVDIRYKNSQNCYNKYGINVDAPIDSNPYGILISLAAMNNDFFITDELISSLFGTLYHLDLGAHSERKNDNGAMEHAADALLHYFGQSGKPINYLECDTCELISCSSNNLDHLHSNLTLAMACSESILKDNHKIIFSSKSNSNLKATCNVDRGINDGIACDIMPPSYHVTDNNLKPIYFNYVNRDWFNTVGESGAAIVAEVSMKENSYTMKYRYYFKDIYEWAYHYDHDPLSFMFHYYHETGQAQEYLMNGSFEGEITWTAGETGFTPHVLEQVKSTLQKWENDIRWEQSNEYDRFISDVEKHDNYKDVKGVV